MYSSDSYAEFGIAVFMAGGSLPALPNQIDAALLKAATAMKPVTSQNTNEYILSDGKNRIVYNIETKKIKPLSPKGENGGD